MTEPTTAAPRMPRQMHHLPRTPLGNPIPWWVQTVDGTPDYRAISLDTIHKALRDRLCLVCGWGLGPRVAFLFAGGSLLSRQATEPPAHEACATYSAQVCPFLATPTRPDGGRQVIAVWVCRDFDTSPSDIGGPVLRAVDAAAVTWWHAGRPAARTDALDALDAAHATLRGLTDSPGTITHLAFRYGEALGWLPASEESAGDGPEVAP